MRRQGGDVGSSLLGWIHGCVCEKPVAAQSARGSAQLVHAWPAGVASHAKAWLNIARFVAALDQQSMPLRPDPGPCRFHLPVGCRVLSIADVPGELMTVNPIAVNRRVVGSRPCLPGLLLPAWRAAAPLSMSPASPLARSRMHMCNTTAVRVLFPHPTVCSPFANVFSRNQRSVLVLEAPGYGKVAYVAIGATVSRS